MDENSPVGVFDSGVGGISVLKELVRLMPEERYLYFGDTLHAPYGTKSPSEVLGYVRQVVEHLKSKQIKALVIACNTATSVAARQLREENSTLPIIGMEPALKPAAETRRGGKILVLATPMTLRLPKFQALMAKYGEGAVPLPCPGLMELVETLSFDQARRYLQEHFDAFDMDGVDAVVLGCTHYVFLRPIIADMVPPTVQIMDGNVGTVHQLDRVLRDTGLRKTAGQGSVTLETSGDPAIVVPLMQRLMSL